jgi:hypothetical protein
MRRKIMSSTKTLFAALVVAVAVGPLAADVPDGRGGRTSPQAVSVTQPGAPDHACCDRAAPAVRPAPARTGADIKARGYLAQIGVPDAPRACYKRMPLLPRVGTTPAELKARGHVAASGAPARPAVSCCASGLCPMRPAGVAMSSR